MDDYRMIISGIIGSVITLICTAIIDYFKEKYKSNVELKKMIFQRQTDAAEKAISWLQESLDCFRMLQFACAEINENLNPVALVKLFNASKQADKLSSETNSRLNQIYLYYDFSEIEKKYNIYQASLDINHIITEILKLDYQASDLRNQGKDDNSDEIKLLKEKALLLFLDLHNAIDIIINALIAMQNVLRGKYSKYDIE